MQPLWIDEMGPRARRSRQAFAALFTTSAAYPKVVDEIRRGCQLRRGMCAGRGLTLWRKADRF
jgi:hypothetical protein